MAGDPSPRGRWTMSETLLPIVVPAVTEVFLLMMCLRVWVGLRRLQMRGVSEWVLAAVIVDAGAQVWHLLSHLGMAAGLAWLIHVFLSYAMVYVLYRLGHLVFRLQEAGGQLGEVRMCAEKEGGGAS